ncbi:hypothetical protein ACHAW6_012933 [Cyclotella cf. meneghiniana]
MIPVLSLLSMEMQNLQMGVGGRSIPCGSIPRSDSWEPTVTKEILSNGFINNFYRANNKTWHSDTMWFNMVKGCFDKAMTYWISLRIRVSSSNPLSYFVSIRGPKANGSGWMDINVFNCPTQSQSDRGRT